MTVLTFLDNMLQTFHTFDFYIHMIISKYQLQDYRTQTMEQYKHSL